MNPKLLARVRSVYALKEAAARSRAAEARAGIAAGRELAAKYDVLDCGLGAGAQFAIAYVAHASGIIERGIAALGEREAEATLEAQRLDAIGRRLDELRHDAVLDVARDREARDLEGLIERMTSGVKSGVSDTADDDEGSI